MSVPKKYLALAAEVKDLKAKLATAENKADGHHRQAMEMKAQRDEWRQECGSRDAQPSRREAALVHMALRLSQHGDPDDEAGDLMAVTAPIEKAG